jgi:aminoglycoside 2''-phosphotransferase
MPHALNREKLLPEMSDKIRQRIKTLMPNLKIRRLKLVDEGLFNKVLIVNNEYVFRFTRTDEGAEILEREKRILDLVQPKTGVRIPAPTYCDGDCMIYPYIEGEPLLLEKIGTWDEETQNRVAGSLGRFLFDLHSIDISEAEPKLPATLAPVKRDRWLKIYSGIKETVYPFLWKYQVQWAERVFNEMINNEHFFEYKPVLIHGDLRPYHILMDRRDHGITGVIDFGVAGMGDPASDFGTLINTYGESFVAKMKKVYPDLGRFLPRARFYAQALELHWFWLGLELKDKFWFAAHLGCARDIRN